MTDRRPLSPAKSLKLPMEVPRAWSWLIDLIFRRFFIKVDIMNLLVSVSWRCHGRIFDRARILREGSYCQWASMGKSTKKKAVQRKTVIIQVKREYHLIINLSMDLKIFEADQSQLRGCGWIHKIRCRVFLECIFRLSCQLASSIFINPLQPHRREWDLEAIAKSPRCRKTTQLPQPYYFLHSPYH